VVLYCVPQALKYAGISFLQKKIIVIEVKGKRGWNKVNNETGAGDALTLIEGPNYLETPFSSESLKINGPFHAAFMMMRMWLMQIPTTVIRSRIKRS
jgi:hypothetical protein